MERPALSDGFGWTAIQRPSQQAMLPQAECRNVYDLWRGLALRMELEDGFPWENVESLLDFRVAALGMTFSEFAERHAYHMRKLEFKKYEKTGFATPSGKVELKSAVPEGLGYDPLPYYRAEPKTDPTFPYMAFMGVREDRVFSDWASSYRFVAGEKSRT